MKGINTGRWLAGGVAAGVLIWLLEGLSSVVYMEDMEAAMKAHNLSMEMSAAMVFHSILVSLLVGLVLVFFYAAVRPRFGPGPRTAIIVAVAMWVGGMVVSLIGYMMMGLFPHSIILMWAIVGLIEWILASLVGGWIYRE